MTNKLSDQQSSRIQSEVIRMIKNKLEPLNMKYYDFKYSQNQIKKSSSSDNISKLLSHQQKNHNPHHIIKRVKRLNIPRKAIIKLPMSFSAQQYERLQRKVECHLQMKKILKMEKTYRQIQQNCLTKKKGPLPISNSPLQKYLQLFESTQQPSDKTKLTEEENISDLLNKVYLAKSTKNIQSVQDASRCLWNQQIAKAQKIKIKKSNKKIRRNSFQNNNSSQWRGQNKGNINKISKKQEGKLKKQIMNDIQIQYRKEGSSKIRIIINHKKMISYR